MSIANNMKALMFKYDITQETLAKICNVTQASVSYWISGDRKPSSSCVKKICQYFNIEPSEILGERGLAYKTFGDVASDEKLTELEQKFSKLSEKEKDLVLALVDRLARG